MATLAAFPQVTGSGAMKSGNDLLDLWVFASGGRSVSTNALTCGFASTITASDIWVIGHTK
jgi:hypothetical protein